MLQTPRLKWLEHWGLARHAWRRLPAPLVALHVDAATGAVAVADPRHSARLLAFNPLGESAFEVRPFVGRF